MGGNFVGPWICKNLEYTYMGGEGKGEMTLGDTKNYSVNIGIHGQMLEKGYHRASHVFSRICTGNL